MSVKNLEGFLGKVGQEHRANREADEKAHQKERSLDERVKSAFKDHQTMNAKVGKEGVVVREKIGDAKQPALTEEKGKMVGVKPEGSKPALSPEQIAQQPIKTKTEGTVPENVYRNVPPSSSSSPKNLEQARAATQFVVAQRQTPLSDLLLKRSSIPPAPPTEEKDQSEKEVKLDAAVILKESPDAKVKGPVASDAGAKLDTKKQSDADPKTDKKKEGKRADSKEGSSGAYAARGAKGSDGEQRLEAASSGVSSGGEEKPGIEIFNPEKKIDENMAVVLEKKFLLDKIYKNISDPQKAEAAVAVLQNAVAVDKEADAILRLGLAARLNVYGGTGA